MVEEKLDITVHTFMGSITPETVNKMVHEVETAIVANDNYVYLRMSSPGGEVASAIAAYNCLIPYSDRIITHNLATADSASMMIFLAGDHRVASPESSFLVHPVSRVLNGPQTITSRKAHEMYESLESDENRMCRIVASRTKFREQEYRTMMQTAKTLPAPFARRKGVIQDIVTPDKLPMNYVAEAFRSKLRVSGVPARQSIVDSIGSHAGTLVRIGMWVAGQIDADGYLS